MNAIDRIEGFARFGWILGLERMNVLMELLGNPQEALKCIHVAGTNGKGSVCRYIYEALEANGYRCGLFTSPFIEVFNERIQFHGEYIADSDLEKITDMVLETVEKMKDMGYTSPTEFEVITAVAFMYFAMKDADFVVLEVGLGGIGDSTNVISKPLVSVITSIALDHTDRLGDTLEKIAAEKAGIIKEGCPVVMNVSDEGAKKVIAKTAYEKHARLYDISSLEPIKTERTIGGSISDFVIQGTNYPEVRICMPGEFQVKNLGTALTALEILRREGYIKLEKDAFYEGIAKARQIGRFEVMKEQPYVILDGAHNPEGAKALADTVTEYFDRDRVLMVTGILKDKDYETIVKEFGRCAHHFIVTEPDIGRKLVADVLVDVLLKNGFEAVSCADRKAAFEMAMSERKNYDAVIFAGSFYLIGEIRRMIKDGKE